MEIELQELINKLIKKGWKPRWESEPIYMLSSKKLYIPDTMEVNRSLRDLVSKESWLWQFVCKNGMIKNPNIDRYWKDYFELDHIEYYQSDFQYWVLESSLKDESELEDFILDNIKICGE